MPHNHFDISIFLDEILAVMPMKGVSQNELEVLKESMLNQLNKRLLQAISSHLEDAVIGDVMSHTAEETDADYIFTELVANSPSAQIAILETLEEFKQDMLQAYKTLEKAK